MIHIGGTMQTEINIGSVHHYDRDPSRSYAISWTRKVNGNSSTIAGIDPHEFPAVGDGRTFEMQFHYNNGWGCPRHKRADRPRG